MKTCCGAGALKIHPQTRTRSLWLTFAALALFWGTSWIPAGTLAEQVPPLLASAVRFLLSAVLLVPVFLFRSMRLPPARILGLVLLLSVTMIVLPTGLLLWVRPQLPSATVTVLYALMPLVAILLTPLFTGGDVPAGALRASVVGLAGLLLATRASFSAAQAGAAALVLIAVIATAASTLMAKRAFAGQNPMVVTAFLLGAAGILLLLGSLLFERGQPVHWGRSAIGSLLLLAAVAGAPAWAAWFWLLQRLEAYQVITLQWAEPLIALAASALLLRMGLSLAMIAGSLITLGSLIAVLGAPAEDDDTVSLLGN